MNKLIKLPLFLGICGAACAGVLAGVNALTSPVIEEAKLDKANAAYIEAFKSFNVKSDEIEMFEGSLPSGCTAKAIIVNESVKGISYTCEAKGYNPGISFQIAFANGKYLSYTDLGNSETPSYGGNLIKKLTSVIGGVAASETLLSNSAYTSAIAGSSVTGKGIANAIEACRADYMSWYATQQ